MQNMADQVATAIDNARLYVQTQAALQEAEATQRRYLGREWARYTTDQQVSGYQQAGDRVTPLREGILPEVQWALREQRSLSLGDEPAMDAGRRDADQLAGSTPAQLVVPIMLSGQPIGALGVKAPEGGRQWSEEDVALAEAVAEQLGLAAENLRLLDQTQRRAAREQLTRQITDSIRAAVNVEDAMQRAIQELGRALHASEMIARIGTERDLLSDPWAKDEERTP
jgi:GAF domain-containing protein